MALSVAPLVERWAEQSAEPWAVLLVAQLAELSAHICRRWNAVEQPPDEVRALAAPCYAPPSRTYR